MVPTLLSPARALPLLCTDLLSADPQALFKRSGRPISLDVLLACPFTAVPRPETDPKLRMTVLPEAEFLYKLAASAQPWPNVLQVLRCG